MILIYRFVLLFIQKLKTALTSDNVNISKMRLHDQGLPVLDGAVALASANAHVSTGFASRYQLQPRAVFLRPKWVGVRTLHIFISH